MTSYVEKCEELYQKHELLKKHAEGLEKVLDDQVKYIKHLEVAIYDLTGQRLTPEHFVGRTEVGK